MWHQIKASWVVIFLVTLLGVGYLWVYYFEPLLSGEAGSNMFAWDRWAHRACTLTNNSKATEWQCDNAMETDGSSSNTNSDVSIRKRTCDAIQRTNL